MSLVLYVIMCIIDGNVCRAGYKHNYVDLLTRMVGGLSTGIFCRGYVFQGTPPLRYPASQKGFSTIKMRLHIEKAQYSVVQNSWDPGARVYFKSV